MYRCIDVRLCIQVTELKKFQVDPNERIIRGKRWTLHVESDNSGIHVANAHFALFNMSNELIGLSIT